LLESVQPAEHMITKLQNIVLAKIEENNKNKDVIIDVQKKELVKIENQIERYTERI
jgi:hypothetical protein